MPKQGRGKGSSKQTNKGGANMVKKVEQEKTATDMVKEMMEQYPEMTGADIARATGVKPATVYAIQSRLRNRANRNQTSNKTKQKRKQPVSKKEPVVTPEKREHHAIGDAGQLDTMLKVSDTLTVPINADKAELFSFVSAFYLDKITEAETEEDALKYHNLLMDMLGR